MRVLPRLGEELGEHAPIVYYELEEAAMGWIKAALGRQLGSYTHLPRFLELVGLPEEAKLKPELHRIIETYREQINKGKCNEEHINEQANYNN